MTWAQECSSDKLLSCRKRSVLSSDIQNVGSYIINSPAFQLKECQGKNQKRLREEWNLQIKKRLKKKFSTTAMDSLVWILNPAKVKYVKEI